MTSSRSTAEPRTSHPARRAALLVLLANTILVGGASAQRARVAAPESVARQVVLADSAGDWAALLRLAHPEALSRFRALQVFQLRLLSRPDWPGYDSLAVDSAGAAEWKEGSARRERFFLDSVFQVPTVDSLAHTRPDTVFARWVRGVRSFVAVDSAGAPPHAEPVFRVVGAVKASDTLAYVVLQRTIRQPLGPVPELFRDYPRETHQTEVMLLRRQGREWKSMLDPLTYSYGYGYVPPAESLE